MLLNNITSGSLSINKIYLKFKNLIFDKSYNKILSLISVSIIMSNPSTKNNVRALLNILFFLINSKKNIQIKDSCDVLFFNSSKKSSYNEPFNTIIDNLINKNISCGLISNTELITIKSDNRSTFSHKKFTPFNYSLNKLSAFNISYKSFFLSLKLIFNSTYDRELFFFLVKRFLIIFSQLVFSQNNTLRLKSLIKSIKPKIVILHNENIPLASELLNYCKKNNINNILFFTEHPDHLVLPIKSDNLWVWSHQILDELKKIDHKLPESKVVGHPESEILLIDKKNTNIKNKFKYLFNDKKIFLFISENTSMQSWVSKEEVNECLRIITNIAKIKTDWIFLIKKRKYNDSLELIENLDNVFLVHDDGKITSDKEINASLSELLSYGIDCSGAITSLGLITTSMLNIPSFKFTLSQNHYEYEFLNHLCKNISCEADLINLLNPESIMKLNNELKIKLQKYYNYQSCTEKMTNLILEKITN